MTKERTSVAHRDRAPTWCASWIRPLCAIGVFCSWMVATGPVLAASPRDQCIAGASKHYQVHQDIIRAVLRTEGGSVGRVSWNSNGTYDIGPMQINSSHLAELAHYGITEAVLLKNECLNVYIGTWMIKKEIVSAPDLWTGLGNYHSHSSTYNADYQWKVWRRLQQVRMLAKEP
ncbi:MAG: lytic transglycosylase domain-containing protein [Rhodanobacter sp.]